MFEGKKIHFQDSLSLGWRVTRVGVRDRDGSRGVGRGEDEDRAKRGRQFLLSFETEELHEIFLNYAKFSHKTVLALFNRYDYLSHNHTVYRHTSFFFVEKSPCLESANCISIVTEQLDSDIESVRRKRTTFEEKCTSSLCFVLFHFFTFSPPSFPFQENGRKFYNKIEATGS